MTNTNTPSALDSQTRAHAAFRFYGGTPYSWEKMCQRDAWTQAVDLVITRGVSGCCAGERLLSGLRTSYTSYPSWRSLRGEDRGHWQSVAKAAGR